MMRIPFFRPSIGDAEIETVADCLRSGWLTTGPNVRAFESEFAALMGGDTQAIAVNSATAALHLGLEALGIGPGDEVIVPTLTFTSTAEVVRYLGARPVFVDMDPATFCIDIQAAADAITASTKAIMPVHFAGRSCDMTALRALADQHDIYIVDDAAHALPTRHAGKLIGSDFADVTAFSFYANKTMTTGEGGMLTTRKRDVAQRCRTMRLHGIDRDVFNRFTDTSSNWAYDVVAPGFKYNMTDMAAAMGRVQLARLDEFAEARTRLAARYDAAFADLPLVFPPAAAKGDCHAMHLYIVQIQDDAPLDRSTLIEALREAGIGTSVHYRPLHQMTYWSGLNNKAQHPAADAYFKRCLSLPLFMAMRDDEQDYVIATVQRALSG